MTSQQHVDSNLSLEGGTLAKVDHFLRPSVLPELVLEKPVVILAGVRGSGKTDRIVRVLDSLGSDASNAGVIITEIKGASTKVDLDRLPAGIVDRVGIEGCACCAANKQVLEAVSGFEKDGRKLILIEQSGYSEASELYRTIKELGFNPVVVAVVNPAQLKGFATHNFRHIRAASVILVSHLDPTSPDFGKHEQALNSFIDSVTSDLAIKPQVLVDNQSSDALSRAFEIVNTRALSSQMNEQAESVATNLGASVGLSSPNARKVATSELKRIEDVNNFQEVQLILHKGVTPLSLLESLSLLKDSQGNTIPVARAKGVMQGKDFDIISTDDGLQISVRQRSTQSELFNGQDYINISSTDPRFKALSVIDLAKTVGLTDLSEGSVSSICENYPSKEEMYDAILQHADLRVAFEEDRNLLELSKIFPSLSEIKDRDQQKNLGAATFELLYVFLGVRADLFEVLNSQHAKNNCPNLSQLVLTASFLACQVCDHPIFQSFISHLKKEREEFALIVDEFEAYKPELMLLDSLSKVDELKINESTLLTSADISIFTYIINSAVSKGHLNAINAKLAADNIDKIASQDPSKYKEWNNISQLLRSKIAT